MSVFNNISNDFYKSLNDLGTNPFVLVVLIIVIIIYYLLFSFLGINNDDDDDEGMFGSGSFVIIEGLLWGLFIILIFINGLSYFFNINLVTEFQNIFSDKPRINISTTNNLSNNNLPGLNNLKTTDISMAYSEVYHIPGNNFTYNDSKALCNAFDGDLATYEQLLDAQKKGANWCSYGWSKDQLALYPTSQSVWKKLQSKEGHEYDCGLPGLNGGYISNPYTKLGANCYGIKPKKSKLDSKYLSQELYPKTAKELLFDKRVNYWKDRISNILILPFNNSNWFKIPTGLNTISNDIINDNDNLNNNNL